MTLEKRQPTADRFLPRREIKLVVLAVSVFDRVFEFVECCGLGVQQFSVAVQKPVVDDTVQRHPFRSPARPEWLTRSDDATRKGAPRSRAFRTSTSACLDAFRNGEAAFVEGLPGDRAGQVAASALEFGQIAKVVEGADATARNEWRAGHRQHRTELIQVRPRQSSVPADFGHDERRDTGLSEALGQVQEVSPAAGDPASHCDLTPVRVEADADMTAVQLTQHVDQIGRLDRGRPDDHTIDPGAEQCTGGFDGSNATAGLDSARDRGADALDRPEVAGRAGACGVEIDDVDPARPLRFELTGDRDRIGVINRLRVEVATKQPYRVAAAQVDGRVEVYSAPLVLGSSLPSTRTASRRQRATPLNDASIT